MVAGAAAALTGSAYLASSSFENNKEYMMVSQCDKGATVVEMLQGISASVKNIESTLGVVAKAPVKRAHGIDVVLGAQWGDEGKGKLVDMLSQVCSSRIAVKCNALKLLLVFEWLCLLTHRKTPGSMVCFESF
jgi:hypothetical protein